MKISVLDLTSHPEVLHGQPRAGAQIVTWMQRGLPEARYRCHDVAQGGEALPVPGDFDGLVVSGSEAGVYDDTPWMQPLRALLLATRAAAKPIYGICFGHQIMADTFGGRAGKCHDAVLGAQRFSLEGAPVDVHVWHQDQVTQLPPGARVTASAAYCPLGGLAYDFPAASVQFHPEYTEDTLRALFDLLRGDVVGEAARDAALRSFETADVRPDLAVREMAAFFRAHAGTVAA